MRIFELTRLYHRWKRWIVDGLMLRGWRKRFPDKIVIETTNICSLRCTCCPNGNDVIRRKPGKMTRETFDRVLANMDFPVKVCFLHMCGEPFLNQDLDYFCERLLEKRIIPTIFSNGYGIDFGLLDRILKLKGVKISFSMELHSRETYESIRVPGCHSRALQYIAEIDRKFAEANRMYGLNVILTGEDDAKSVEKTTRQLFRTYSRLSSITYSSEWPWPGLPGTGNLPGHLSVYNSMCHQAKSLPAVLWDGTMSFCNLDYSGEMVIGNLVDEPLSRIINNRQSRRFRRMLAMRNMPAGSLCGRCVLPRYNNLALNVTRGKISNFDEVQSRGYFSQIDDYFRQ